MMLLSITPESLIHCWKAPVFALIWSRSSIANTINQPCLNSKTPCSLHVWLHWRIKRNWNAGSTLVHIFHIKILEFQVWKYRSLKSILSSQIKSSELSTSRPPRKWRPPVLFIIIMTRTCLLDQNRIKVFCLMKCSKVALKYCTYNVI